MKKIVFLVAGIVLATVVCISLGIAIFSNNNKQYIRGDDVFTENDITESLRAAATRLKSDEDTVIAYVNGESVTNRDVNI